MKMQQEAEDDMRRVRKYLVATDLSDEAAHALEWTVGTVLRDGDTLVAIYCVDEETVDQTSGAIVADYQNEKAQAAAVVASAGKPSAASVASAIISSPLAGSGRRSGSTANSPMGRERGSRAEQDRHKAVEEITARVTRLLRKTKLQVRVVIEVIHCKEPKHLITDIIDTLEPTLVILGSRGRSALKGLVIPFHLTLSFRDTSTN
jgi:nucleotide-binding universal stress UspA family protein